MGCLSKLFHAFVLLNFVGFFNSFSSLLVQVEFQDQIEDSLPRLKLGSLESLLLMAGTFDDGTEPTISIQDYLQEVEERELEADLILGGDEGKDCTYTKGYMKRQAIFSCLTCNPDGKAGVCTACSLSCHDGHEILELWTKRNFRCDCGNSKFGEVFCKIFPNKDVENVGNSYNHNFKGLYCTCNRLYPDPDEEQVEMIQCCVCEDWFHEEHLGLESIPEIPRDEEGEPLYEDFICKACSEICSFLRLYPSDILASGIKCDDSIKISTNDIVLKDSPSGSGISQIANLTTCHDSLHGDPVISNLKSDSVLRMEVSKEIHGAKSPDGCGNQSAVCVLGVTNDVDSPVLESKAMFLSKNWREALCRCAKCSSSYRQKSISFLLDKEDSILEYEKMGKRKREEKLQQQEGAELSLLDNLGHVEKIEILNGIAEMKDEMRAFLESCDASKPITTDDIHRVFENLAKKRRRSD